MRAMSHMSVPTRVLTVAAALAAAAGGATSARAVDTLGPVFVIAMENHNWTQPAGQTSPQQIYQNPAAPYHQQPGHARQRQRPVRFVLPRNYHNSGVGIHPSEPNYIWNEAGTNFGVLNDNDPFGTGGTNQNTNQHLTGLMQASGGPPGSRTRKTSTWPRPGQPADQHRPAARTSGPSRSPASAARRPAYTNPYNGSNQYNYAVKHDGAALLHRHQRRQQRHPHQPRRRTLRPAAAAADGPDQQHRRQVQLDHPRPVQRHAHGADRRLHLQRHPLTGDPANIAQGDNFLSIVVPQIMASDAYQNQTARS